MILGLTPVCPAAEDALQLPTPHYERAAGDPAWLAQAAQFHGHLGPWMSAGLRFGMAGVKAVGARGFFDLEVDVQGPLVVPPQSCFLDGLQISTGATLGKRNLRWTKADRLLVRVKNSQTGKTVEIRPSEELLNLLGGQKPSDKPAAHADNHRTDPSFEDIARPAELGGALPLAPSPRRRQARFPIRGLAVRR